MVTRMSKGVAVVTGASSGIGAAIARQLKRDDFELVLGARRHDQLREIAEEISARWMPLDVTDEDSVEHLCAELETCRVLVNKAGGALGVDRVENEDSIDRLTIF